MSIEDQLSEIERKYQQAYDMLSNISETYLSRYHTKAYLSDAIKAVLAFQRSIELLYEDIAKLSDKKTQRYVNRCYDNLKLIIILIRGRGSYGGLCENLDDTEYHSAFHKFRKIRSCMYEILEDVRLIYALRLYPIEEKMALKSKLTDYGFIEVTRCLDEAEENLATKHFKDSIDRSREALEKTIFSILATEDKKPSKHFSTDIGTLSGLGIIDKETKRLTEATYSYLSEVGAHGRGEKLTLGDAHYAIKETFMRIDILLKKYTEYQKNKKKT